jgi:hypothetical protein
MAWQIEGPEMNMAPEHFQERLTELGGSSRYDDPLFIIFWGQYAYGPGSFRSGGVWSVDEQYFKGYRDLLKGSGEPCWVLAQWNPPEAYGSPEAFYIQNYDDVTGLQLIGEYPYSGRYEVLFNLRWNEIENGKITFHTMPLNNSVFDMVANIVKIAKDVSFEKTKAAYEAARELEEHDKLLGVERHLRDSAIPFSGAVSYTRQGIRSTVIDKKMMEMQRTWAATANAAKGLRPGLQTR